SLLYVSMYYSFVAYNALHSFPTRRSSDLVQVLFHHRGARQVRLNTATKKARQAAALALVQQDEHSHQNCGDDQYDLQSQNHELRSEEHTSELQSRFDLVCRLLLEKKKNQH